MTGIANSPDKLSQMPISDGLGSCFHYTSGEGLLGILREGRVELWSTNIMFMKDAQEWGVFQNALRILRDEGMSEDPLLRSDRSRAVLERCLSEANAWRNEEIFVTCFSRMADDLSQWRGYTPINDGYSIEFATGSLLGSLPELRARFARVKYDTERDLAAKLAEEVEANALRAQGASLDAVGAVMAEFWERDAPYQKHESFWAEKEVRLMIDRSKLDAPPAVHFRKGNGFLIPYLILELEPEVVQSVTIGPRPDPDLAAQSVKRLLKERGLNHVRVKASQSPFRS